jgi:hypothetical protein
MHAMKPTRAWKAAAVAGSVLLGGGYVAWRVAHAPDARSSEPTTAPEDRTGPRTPATDLMPGSKSLIGVIRGEHRSPSAPPGEPAEEPSGEAAAKGREEAERRKKEAEEAARGTFYGSKSMPFFDDDDAKPEGGGK